MMPPVVYAVARVTDDEGHLDFMAGALRRLWTRALWEARLFPTAEKAAEAAPDGANVYPLILGPAAGDKG